MSWNKIIGWEKWKVDGSKRLWESKEDEALLERDRYEAVLAKKIMTIFSRLHGGDSLYIVLVNLFLHYNENSRKSLKRDTLKLRDGLNSYDVGYIIDNFSKYSWLNDFIEALKMNIEELRNEVIIGEIIE